MKVYLELFLIFLKLGTFTLGGGYAMIPLIYHEIVEKKKWIGSHEFTDILALAQSAPGALAVNTATFVGYKVRGIFGMLCTILGVLTPSVIIIWLLAKYSAEFYNNEYVIKIFKGIKPMIVSLIFYSVYNIAKKSNVNKKDVVLLVLIALAVSYFNLQPIFLILAGGFISVLYSKYRGME